MTPYSINESEESDVAQKPKSIMVSSGTNGELNGNAVKLNGDIVDTPDSIPSRSSVSGKSIIGNGKNGKSGTLKRVSFGSSKGSMVETLVYDHQEDLLHEQPLPPFAVPPLVNGEDSRLHPAKVRVKFIESQHLAQVLSCPSSTSTPSSPDVTLDFSETMTSPTVSDGYARQVSVESGMDNPFRPDGELSKEADTIVNLIREGKPITPVKAEESVIDGSAAVVANGHPAASPDAAKIDSVVASPVKEVAITPTEASVVKSGVNGTAPPKETEPGVVEVRHGVIAAPTEAPPVEQVVIKKKPKCKCCIIQ